MLGSQQLKIFFNKVKSVLYVLFEPRPNLAKQLESRREMRTSEAN